MPRTKPLRLILAAGLLALGALGATSNGVAAYGRADHPLAQLELSANCNDPTFGLCQPNGPRETGGHFYGNTSVRRRSRVHSSPSRQLVAEWRSSPRLQPRAPRLPMLGVKLVEVVLVGQAPEVGLGGRGQCVPGQA